MKCKGDAFDCYQCEIFRPNYNCRNRTKFSETETSEPGKRWLDKDGIQHCNDFIQYHEIEQPTLF